MEAVDFGVGSGRGSGGFSGAGSAFSAIAGALAALFMAHPESAKAENAAVQRILVRLAFFMRAMLPCNAHLRKGQSAIRAHASSEIAERWPSGRRRSPGK
jgi:hypothetical protein